MCGVFCLSEEMMSSEAEEALALLDKAKALLNKDEEGEGREGPSTAHPFANEEIEWGTGCPRRRSKSEKRKSRHSGWCATRISRNKGQQGRVRAVNSRSRLR